MRHLLVILLGAVMAGPLVVGACGSHKQDHEQVMPPQTQAGKKDKDDKPDEPVGEDDLEALRADIERLLNDVAQLNETITSQQSLIVQLNQTISKQQEVITRFLEESQPEGDVTTRQGTCSITANSVTCVWGQ